MRVSRLDLLATAAMRDAANRETLAALRLGYTVSGGASDLLGNVHLGIDDGVVRLQSDDGDPIMTVEIVERRYEALKRAHAIPIAPRREC